MDSFTLNKVAGAVLGTCLIGMGIGIVADEIYTPEKPKKPGYDLPTGAKKGGGSKGPTEAPLSVLLANADAKKGEADAKVCGACHNFEEGAGAKVGPDLYGVVDREKGSAQGFDYSAGMKKKGGKWTYEDLFQFLKKPSAYVQGTKMSYSGEESPEKRAEIIAYLRTLSKSPPPLPKVSEADKKAAEGGGAEQAEGGASGGENQLIALIGESDPKKGESDAKICGACHNFKKGEGNKVGPDLYGVVDRNKGSVEGFDYSPGMKKKGGKWTYEDLDKFLTKPSAFVQGTKMGFGGESSDKKRASIIAYLRSNADKPAPLPKPSAGSKKESAKSDGGKSEGKEAGGGDAFAKLVAAADPQKGEKAAVICGACHNFKKGEGAKVGPDLYGVVDREKGSVEGFEYSPGMKKKGGKWTYDDLNQFLTKPASYVQGTKMGFGGEPDEKKRAAIVAYLRSNADKPAPLPGADSGEKKSEAEPAKTDDKKADDKKQAEPEKKTEAVPAKSEKKADAKPESSASDKKPDSKPETPSADKKAEVEPASPGKGAESGSTGVKIEGADLGPPQPYSAPEPQVPQSAAAGDGAPAASKADSNSPPNPYSASEPQTSQSASTGEDASKAENNAASADTQKADGSEKKSGEATATATSAPSDQTTGGGLEPYSAPTPDEAAANAK